MSLFQVNLNNTQQGLLDKQFGAANTSGSQIATSLQRTVYIMGPGKINRKLKDGDTFQDSNYYKRFCYPQVSLEDAMLTCLTDDGSTWSDVASENTFPYAYSRTIVSGTTYTAANNIFDILGDTNGYATFLQITNKSPATTGRDILVKLNGLATAVFTLEMNSYQVFNAGDLSVSLVEVANTDSGAGDVELEILCAVRLASTT